MNRKVEAEVLDTLPVDDARAIGSRRDLHRINGYMGNAATMAHVLAYWRDTHDAFTLTDIGAGDGLFTLRVARALAKLRPIATVPQPLVMVDRAAAPRQGTLAALAASGWQPTVIHEDVLAWLTDHTNHDVIMTNLLLHHFEDQSLAELLEGIAKRVRLFVAVEPERGMAGWLGSRLLGMIGCTAVTRHDAVVSVRAGFCGREITALWPEPQRWRLAERRAGWCGHLFVAKRIE